MSQSGDEADFQARYNRVRKKYQEMQNLRITSTLADTEDLKKKIQEHTNIHQIATKELRAQNEDIRKKIREYESAEQEIRRLRESNDRVRRDLEMKDPVLNLFLRNPSFRITIKKKDEYEIRYGDKDDLIFELKPSREEDNHFYFKSSHYPVSLSSLVDWISSEVVFPVSHLRGFYDQLCKGLKSCNLMK
jgi:hypothetical protein